MTGARGGKGRWVVGGALLACALLAVIAWRAREPETGPAPSAPRSSAARAEPEARSAARPATARALLGEVLAADGERPVAGAEVRATLADGSSKSAVTDARGEFALEGLRAPIMRVRFKAEGFVEAELEAEALPQVAEAFVTQRLTARAGAPAPASDAPREGAQALEVRVVDARGAPISSYALTVYGRTKSDRVVRSAPIHVEVEDADGRARVPVDVGRYAISVLAEGYRPHERTDAEVRASEDAKVTIALERSIEVRGTVRDADTRRPIAGAQVRVASPGFAPVLTDDQGRFALRTVPAENLSLTVSAHGYLSLDVGGVAGGRSRDEHVDIELSPKKEGQSAEVVGIGVTVAPHPDGVLIKGVIPTGPAAGKIQEGDVIIEVDGVSLKDSRMRERIASIRGALGSRARLTVKKGDGSTARVDVERARVAVPDG